MPESARRRALRAASELLGATPAFRHDPRALAYVRSVLVQADAQLDRRPAFEFIAGAAGSMRFKLDGGRVWVPRCAEAGVALFLTYNTPGLTWPLVAPSLGAARGRISRAVESLARLDLSLANALAPSRGDGPGSHLRSSPWPGLVLLRWQAA
jgi:hypothetical protein